MIIPTIFIVMASFGQSVNPAMASPVPDVRCGSFCLFVALKSLEIGPATFTELETILGPPGPRGYSMLELQSAAERSGAAAMVVETSIENLQARDRPFAAIGLIDNDHYVLIQSVASARVALIDPPRTYETGWSAFRLVWSGKTLLIGKNPLASEESVGRWRFLARRLPILGLGLGVGGTILVGLWIVRGRREKAQSVLALSMLAALILPSGLSGCSRGVSPPPPANVAKVGQWLFIAEERKDLGTIVKRADQQEEVVRIVLENRGPETLNVLGIETSCACTKADVKGRTIKSGGFSILTAMVRIGDNLASNSARIYIASDDPVAPRREIVVSWQVEAPLHTEQTSLNLPPLTPGEGAERTMPIIANGIALCPNCHLQVRGGSSTTECVVEPVVVERTMSHDAPATDNAPETIGLLRVQVHPQTEENFYRDAAHIDLVCGKDRRASFILPVSWSVAAVVQAAPSRTHLGETEPGKSIVRRVVVHSRSGLPFRITGIDPGDSISLIAPVQPLTEDTIHHLEIALTTPKVAGPWRQVVHIRTDHAGAEDVLVAFSGIVN